MKVDKGKIEEGLLLKIQTKLLAFAVICAIVPLCAAFILSFNAAKKSITSAVEDNLVNDAKEQLASLQYKLSTSKKDLVTLSKMGNMQYVINGDAERRLQTDIDIFASSTNLFTEILAADNTGMVVATNLPQFVYTQLSGTWEFEAPALGIHFDGRVVQSYRLNRPIATHSVPLYSRRHSGEIIGALIGSINWDYLRAKLASHHIYGGLQSRQRQFILESLESETILYSTKNVEIPQELLLTATDLEKARRVSHRGQEYLMVTIGSKAVDGFRNPDWRLHVLLDTDIAYAGVEKLKQYFFLAAVAVLSLALTLGLLLARSIVNPVNLLGEGAKRIANGEYDYALDDNGNKDEIAQLTNSFNVMRLAIRDNEQELVKKTELAEQAAKVKGEFLANMSHEVRTPINGVLGMTELLLNTSLDEKQGRYANTIFRSGQALLSVINDILDYSKIEAGKLDLTICPFDLRELVEDVVEMLAENSHRKGVELSLLMDLGSPNSFKGDYARLRQVLLNLLSNAVKFTDKGEVTLKVSFSEPIGNHIAIKFQVIDTGIGIAEENQNQIFDSFVQADGSTTRQFGGTGLGLAISSNLVSLMGGVIQLDSKLGEGSEFWFEISLELLSGEVEERWQSSVALEGRKILIVDDTETNREILIAQVSYWGAESTAVNSGAAALQQLEKAKQNNQPFDIAILDMHMPSMSGLELADNITKTGVAQETILILLSSACDNISSDACPVYGITALIAKPARQIELFNVLTSSLDSGAQSKAGDKRLGSVIIADNYQAHILLVEDNPVNQDMMSELLRILGHTSVICDNGQSAVEAIEADFYDLVLMDCQMPVLDGFGATKSIRSKNAKNKKGERLPIVALTANAMQGDRERCLASGMDDYLSKPVSSAELQSMLRKWLVQNDKPEQQVGNENDSKREFEIHDAANDSSRHSDVRRNVETGSAVSDEADGADELDEQVFSDLWNMCAQAPPGYYENILGKFEQASHEDIENIRTGLQSRDPGMVSASAHRLKSSSSSLGGKHLSALCQAVEKLARVKDLDHVGDLVAEIEASRHRILIQLHSKSSKAA